ncbi:unnamed protein product, partial [Heterosigma akashiwo]
LRRLLARLRQTRATLKRALHGRVIQNAAIEALDKKIGMFTFLQSVLVVYSASEVSAHVVVEAGGALWHALVLYEAMEVVCFALVGWCFTP